ncbi:MAG: ATP cone domain-containing protein, partial [archaeon]
KKGKKEIQSSSIGEIIMKKIKQLDNVAYIRFASVYRDFQDAKDFKKELRELK